MQGTPSISIIVVRMSDRIALVTKGMSDLPMTVPDGEAEYQYAELVMYLPEKWPLKGKAANNPAKSWPFEWMRRIARYPHEQ